MKLTRPPFWLTPLWLPLSVVFNVFLKNYKFKPPSSWHHAHYERPQAWSLGDHFSLPCSVIIIIIIKLGKNCVVTVWHYSDWTALPLICMFREDYTTAITHWVLVMAFVLAMRQISLYPSTVAAVFIIPLNDFGFYQLWKGNPTKLFLLHSFGYRVHVFQRLVNQIDRQEIKTATRFLQVTQ